MALKAETKERAIFCSHCGAAVRPEAEACPVCGSTFEGLTRGKRCPSCGAVCETNLRKCPTCSHEFQAQGTEGEMEGFMSDALEFTKSLLEDRRSRLEKLEGRMEKTRLRMAALEGSTKDQERMERARLGVWLKEAEGQRQEALRFSEGLVRISDTLSKLRARLAEVPLPAPRTKESQDRSRREGGTAGDTGKQEWMAAQSQVQKDLMSMAKEINPDSVAALQVARAQVRKEREDLISVLEEVRKIFDELPGGVQKKLRKSGRLEQLEGLLGKEG